MTTAPAPLVPSVPKPVSLTFPCVATFIVLFNELGWKDTLKSIAIMLVTATLFGAAAHLLFLHIV